MVTSILVLYLLFSNVKFSNCNKRKQTNEIYPNLWAERENNKTSTFFFEFQGNIRQHAVFFYSTMFFAAICDVDTILPSQTTR